MAVTIGRLRKDNVFDYKFVALSHNTIRGAAGGAILNAELLKTKGFLK
jgi:aspartate-semialdehyde dehydrogenase